MSTRPERAGARDRSRTVLDCIVDEGEPLEDGQIHVRSFVQSLRPWVEQAVDRVARRHGRGAADCPWIDHYVERFAARPVSELRSAVRRWLTGPLPGTLDGLRQAIASRAEQGARTWFETGRPPELPPGFPQPSPTELASQAMGAAGTWAARWLGRWMRAALPGAPSAVPPDARAAAARLGPGMPLDPRIRTRAERSLGSSLAHVRVHSDHAGSTVAERAGAQAVA